MNRPAAQGAARLEVLSRLIAVEEAILQSPAARGPDRDLATQRLFGLARDMQAELQEMLA